MCLIGFRADEKARKETNFFTRTYQHSKLCMNCLAEQHNKHLLPHMLYKNFHSSAAHRLAPIGTIPSCWSMPPMFCFLFLKCLKAYQATIPPRMLTYPSLLRLRWLCSRSWSTFTLDGSAGLAHQVLLSRSYAPSVSRYLPWFVCKFLGVLDPEWFLRLWYFGRPISGIFHEDENRMSKGKDSWIWFFSFSLCDPKAKGLRLSWGP